MNIKELRKKYKITQLEISKSIGVSENTVCKWERGGMFPSPENEVKLKAYFEGLERQRIIHD